VFYSLYPLLTGVNDIPIEDLDEDLHVGIIVVLGDCQTVTGVPVVLEPAPSHRVFFIVRSLSWE